MNLMEFTGGTSYKAWLRGAIAVLIAVLTSILSKSENLNWTAFVFATIQGLVTWASFLDQSLSDKPKP